MSQVNPTVADKSYEIGFGLSTTAYECPTFYEGGVACTNDAYTIAPTYVKDGGAETTVPISLGEIMYITSGSDLNVYHDSLDSLDIGSYYVCMHGTQTAVSSFTYDGPCYTHTVIA
jgi:hypothetical protein